MRTKVKVLVVDDSAFFRGRITHILERNGEIEVVGHAANGQEAVEMTSRLRPDLITMDVEMPVLDGISAVRRIMARHPTDVLMFSALTQDGARATLDALEAGAVDFLPKHSVGDAPGAESNGRYLRDRILALSARRRGLPRAARPLADVAPRTAATAHPRRSTELSHPVELVVIGASTGGPVALQKVLTALPAGFGVPVLVAVHMPATFTATFAERLHHLCPLEVAEASDNAPLRPGRILISPGDMQTLVDGRSGALRVQVRKSKDQLYKPSVDLCFGSAARVLGGHVLGIVLTGMGADGKHGAKLLKDKGASIWSQDAASCTVYGMPQAVEKAGLSDRVMPIDALGPALTEAI